MALISRSDCDLLLEGVGDAKRSSGGKVTERANTIETT
jgi:hypothetical protein